MAYLNKIDINGRTYYLQHLTDGKYEAILPAMTKDSKIIIQDASSGNVGDTDTPVYIKDNKVTAFNKSIGDAVTPVYVRYGNIQPLSDDVGSATNPIYMKAGAITASTETMGSGIVPIYMKDGVITPSDSTVGSGVKPMYLNNGTITESDATVGSGIVPTYMSAGTITASTETVGSNIKPIYMNDGEITESDATVGSGIKPIYMQDGTITASNETVGTNIKPIYLNDGTITESDATVGSSVVPTYMNNGEITASTTTVGSNVKPIYLNAGALTVSDGNVGSEIIPVYMVDGEITQTTKTVGSGIKPIYMSDGVITAFASTVGAINQPIYMNNGEITVCSDNVGSAGVPVYMENGVITACDTIPIESGGTGATTPEQARENLEITPANIGAAEAGHTHQDLNTKSGRVLLGSKSNNHWLKPQRVENNSYALGSSDNYWDAAYINQISANGSELEIIDDLKVKPTGVDRAAIRIDLPVDDSGNFAREYMLLWQEGDDAKKEPVAKFGLGTGKVGSNSSSIKNEMKLYADKTTLTQPLTIESGGTGATTAAEALTNLGITATVSELNKMDGVTVTAAEINYLEGITSNIQTQLNGKAESGHTHQDLDTSSGKVRLGSEAKKSGDGYNHWLRPKRAGNDSYSLGSADNYWDVAYVDQIISANNGEVKIVDNLKVQPDGVDTVAVRLDLPTDDSGSYAREYILLLQEGDDTKKEPVAKIGLATRKTADGNSTIQNEMKLYSDKTTLRKPLTIESGGTGAATAEQALKNLGLTVTAEELNKLANSSNSDTSSFIEVVKAFGEDYDMNTVFTSASGGQCKIYRTNAETYNTPRKPYGKDSTEQPTPLTKLAQAYILTVTSGASYGKQIAYVSGGATFERILNNGTIGSWTEIGSASGTYPENEMKSWVTSQIQDAINATWEAKY